MASATSIASIRKGKPALSNGTQGTEIALHEGVTMADGLLAPTEIQALEGDALLSTGHLAFMEQSRNDFGDGITTAAGLEDADLEEDTRELRVLGLIAEVPARIISDAIILVDAEIAPLTEESKPRIVAAADVDALTVIGITYGESLRIATFGAPGPIAPFTTQKAAAFELFAAIQHIMAAEALANALMQIIAGFSFKMAPAAPGIDIGGPQKGIP